MNEGHRIGVMVSIMKSHAAPSEKGGIVYLVRHGKTKLNGSKGTDSADRIRGWSDVPLDSTGEEEAKELGEWFANKPVQAIFSSDLSRAYNTANAIAKTTGARVHRDKDFRPWDLGRFTGEQSKNIITELKDHIHHPDKPVPGGEPFNDFMDRYLPALQEVFRDVEDGLYDNVVVVAHYRNLKAAHAWIESGMSDNVDTKVMMADDIPPASVMEFKYGGGKKWSYKIIPYDEISKQEAESDPEEYKEGEEEESDKKGSIPEKA